MLIVIAIIAILAAMLFPVLAKARMRGQQATCVSNLRQIGLALMQYADDHDDVLPRATGLRQSRPGMITALPGVLAAYLPGRGPFHCPGDSGNARFMPQNPSFWPAVLSSAYGSSYAYTSQAPGDATPRGAWAEPWWRYWRGGRGRREFRNPSGAGLLADTLPWHRLRDTGATAESMAQAGYNVLCLDGHVKLVFGPERDRAMGPLPDPAQPNG